MENTGSWMSINDYSNLKKTSISTIRRHIKASRLKWKKESGKYFIYLSKEKYSALFSKGGLAELEGKLVIEELSRKMRLLESENNELKMLVQLYEDGHRLEKKTFKQAELS